MFKNLFYVSILLSTASSYLFAMESELTDDKEKKNSRALVPYNPQAQSTPLNQTMTIFERSAALALSHPQNKDMEVLEQSFPPVLTLYKKAGSYVMQCSLSIHCKNSIPGLSPQELENLGIEIDSNTIPYIMSYPFIRGQGPLYVTEGTFKITVSEKSSSKPQSFKLPMNTKYQEKVKFDFKSPNDPLELDITFKAKGYPNGKIEDGKWTPLGKPIKIGVLLWCTFNEIKVDTLYLDITRGYSIQ